LLHALNDIRITRVGNNQSANSEIFTAGSTEIDVVAVVVVDTALGQHSVVFNFGLSQGRAVVSNDNQLGFSSSDQLETGLVTKSEFTALNYELETSINRLLRFFFCFLETIVTGVCLLG
jgi:hypothetical protein